MIAFGRIRKVDDIKKAEKICREICLKFTDDGDYIQAEINSALSRVQCLEMTVEYMTGKEVNEK